VGSLLVVTGPPGAGKSSVARVLAAQADASVLVEGDAFFRFLATGRIEPWRAESRDQNTVVTRAAAAAAGHFARGGYATVYDGVVGPWFLDTFLAATGLDELDYAVLLPTVERCVARVMARTGHEFADEEATRTMHAEFERARIGARHVLRDPPEGVEDTVAVVRVAHAGGTLRYCPAAR
jgi:cytidylate kinase